MKYDIFLVIITIITFSNLIGYQLSCLSGTFQKGLSQFELNNKSNVNNINELRV